MFTARRLGVLALVVAIAIGSADDLQTGEDSFAMALAAKTTAADYQKELQKVQAKCPNQYLVCPSRAAAKSKVMPSQAR